MTRVLSCWTEEKGYLLKEKEGWDSELRLVFLSKLWEVRNKTFFSSLRPHSDEIGLHSNGTCLGLKMR